MSRQTDLWEKKAKDAAAAASKTLDPSLRLGFLEMAAQYGELASQARRLTGDKPQAAEVARSVAPQRRPKSRGGRSG